MENKIQSKSNSVPLYITNLGSFTVALLLMVCWGFFVSEIDKRFARADGEQTPTETDNSLDMRMFDNLELTGRAFLVWDATREEAVYAQNDTDQLPLASLTKLMTALLATETLPPYFSIEDPELIKSRWSLGDLVAFTLVTSSNRGASTIANAVDNLIEDGQTPNSLCAVENTDNCNFIFLMNKRARELGLEQTYFTNPTGLDNDSGSSGGYGSARDVAKLMTYIQKNKDDILKPTTKSKYLTQNEAGYEVFVDNTNFSVDLIPGILGSKTGLTDFAGGNLAVILDAGFDEPYALVVLGSTEAGRFEDMDKLIAATREYLAVNNGTK